MCYRVNKNEVLKYKKTNSPYWWKLEIRHEKNYLSVLAFSRFACFIFSHLCVRIDGFT